MIIYHVKIIIIASRLQLFYFCSFILRGHEGVLAHYQRLYAIKWLLEIVFYKFDVLFKRGTFFHGEFFKALKRHLKKITAPMKAYYIVTIYTLHKQTRLLNYYIYM